MNFPNHPPHGVLLVKGSKVYLPGWIRGILTNIHSAGIVGDVVVVESSGTVGSAIGEGVVVCPCCVRDRCPSSSSSRGPALVYRG